MTGELFINGKDAYTQWGVSFEDGAIAKLMTPPPNKQPVTNKNVTDNGAYVVAGTGLYDERTVSLDMHIVSKSQADFMEKYDAFFQELHNGALAISTKYQPGLTYHMYYVDCQQYAQYAGLAKFTLSLYEPNPQNRTTT